MRNLSLQGGFESCFTLRDTIAETVQDRVRNFQQLMFLVFNLYTSSATCSTVLVFRDSSFVWLLLSVHFGKMLR